MGGGGAVPLFKKGHGRTLHPNTHFGSTSRCKLKRVGVSVPRRGEGSGVGVAKRKVRVAKRQAQNFLRLPFGKPHLPFGKPHVADGGERGGGGGGRALAAGSGVCG